ncbi:MAG: sulfur transferase domain-containing protein [Rhodanobacter sp.]
MFHLLLCFAALVPPDTATAGPVRDKMLAGLSHASFPALHRVAAGALQASDIAMLKAAGVHEVINLRADSESPGFDEAAVVRKAGIRYANLPINGASDLTHSNVVAFDRLLAGAGDRLTLVHCASSNRVGAMIALRAAVVGGQSTEAALAEGRRWGLKSLEPAVRERLEEWSASGKLTPATQD